MVAAGTPRVLCLDLEGGWGGSSRSLYYLIRSRVPEWWQPVIVTRRPGPIAGRYKTLAVAQLCIPEMPAFRPSERNNPVAFALFLWGLRHLPAIMRRLRALVAEHRIELIHVNHESLALCGLIAARRLGLPWVCHVRTQLIPGIFARLVYRLINRHAAGIVFIAEPNRAHFARLVGRAFDGAKTCVIHNPAPAIDPDSTPLPALSEPAEALRVLSLTNFSPNRGVDRIVEVAAMLKRRGRDDVVFFLCGALANTRRLPGARNRYLEDMQRRVEAEGLAATVRFPGHVDEPERAVLACHALIKLTRQSNPWGRDIIEAMTAGLPVITLGAFQGFVEDGVNGFIDRDYDPARIADHLIRLRDAPDLRRRISHANRDKARSLFDGRACASRMAAVYAKVIG
ncbi:MAG: glycosyltransferase family 4 protein [Alphaproteobacteria bacterium]|nr:glycosyltransferase family 4 protein [Alphaproteobacteria bacterium]MDP6518096.1 glycosyltransferase family 4 protein [Alphaproteobacteria bacterium]